MINGTMDEWKENVKQIVQKVSKQQIAETLTNYFELDDMPEILAISRAITSIKGFALIKKKIFAFDIVFVKNEKKNILNIVLRFGSRHIIEAKEILLKEDEAGIEVYLKENMQLLFAVYF